jgi:anthraniloyl-CoA monooxygenase
LYFAILMKKANPECSITVIERNQADSTFGWGIVFSDKTMDGFRDRRPPTVRRDRAQFPSLGQCRRLLQGPRIISGRPWLLRHRAAETAADLPGTGQGTRASI